MALFIIFTYLSSGEKSAEDKNEYCTNKGTNAFSIYIPFTLESPIWPVDSAHLSLLITQFPSCQSFIVTLMTVLDSSLPSF